MTAIMKSTYVNWLEPSSDSWPNATTHTCRQSVK